MLLTSLRLQNFRSCRDVTVFFDGYTCLVGSNGAGKSTILTALNILFRNTSGSATNVVDLGREDFCGKNVSQPITITATFDSLSTAEAAELSAYVRHGKLVLSARATWNVERGTAEVRQFGSRLVMLAFAEYFEAAKNSLAAKDLRAIYNRLRLTYSELPAESVKSKMEVALREYEEAHPELCEILESEDQFYGWSKGSNRLSRFFQWVYIPAVKDAATEQEEARNTALGDLLQRTIQGKVLFDDDLSRLHDDVSQKYATIVAGHQETLQFLSRSLEGRLRRWAHPGSRVELQWDVDNARLVSLSPPHARISIGEHNFIGDVARSGHGMQRAFIVSLLQELADIQQEDSPTLLLGFEEPELYQHPPQARHLASLLEELVGNNAQVIVTTHSPYFISGKGFENIRMVRKSMNDGLARVSQLTHEALGRRLGDALGMEAQAPSATMAAIEQILQPSQNEMFFCGLPVFVEGIEDVAFLATVLQLSGQWRTFRKNGCHFIVSGGKTNLSRPLAIAAGLEMPTFTIFDADTDDESNRYKHERDNRCILNLSGHVGAEVWPTATFMAYNVVMWHTKIFDAVVADVGIDAWTSAEEHARAAGGLQTGVRRKSTLLIAGTLEALWAENVRSPILERACARLLTHAEEIGVVDGRTKD